MLVIGVLIVCQTLGRVSREGCADREALLRSVPKAKL